jgi:hypothetical protein
MRNSLPYEIIYGRDEEFEEWRTKIPAIQFPGDWKVTMIPPFGGAIVRFWIWIPGTEDKDIISVYLDCYDRLGCAGEPYWEVYPYQGDCGRCLMNETKKLLEMIADRSELEQEELE